MTNTIINTMKKAEPKNNREAIKEQILAIRDSGQTNMFDQKKVMEIANEMDFYKLFCFIVERPNDYSKFIISGDEKLLPE